LVNVVYRNRLIAVGLKPEQAEVLATHAPVAENLATQDAWENLRADIQQDLQGLETAVQSMKPIMVTSLSSEDLTPIIADPAASTSAHQWIFGLIVPLSVVQCGHYCPLYPCRGSKRVFPKRIGPAPTGTASNAPLH